MVGVGARPRIDWHGGASASGNRAAADGPQAPLQPETRIIAEPAFLVLAVLDQPGGALSEHDRQLIAAARQLADADRGAVVALAIGAIDGLGAAGADRAMALPPDLADNGHPEFRVAAVAAAIAKLKPRHIVFAESAEGGADLARRIAAISGERLFSGVEAITAGRVSRRARGGKASMLAAVPAVMSIAENAFPRHEGPPHEAREIASPAFSVRRSLERATRLPADPDRIALGEADFILSAGNGVTDWESFAELGEVLGATRAGSRVVCDEGHLPRDRQVGASGSVVTARCYLAFGISGAPQHLQGITGVSHVVAINTDLHAEMIKRADLAIIADAQDVMPALCATLGSAAMLRAAVLLSVGRHPASGRERRAPLDARALELALRLPAAEVHAVHAGDPTQTALRDYLGMGLARLTVLAMPPGRDPVAPLMAHLATLAPDVIFAGSRAEGGEDSGMLPYLVAQGLGCAVVADVAEFTVAEGRARLTQALPRGRRRLVEARFPVVAIVDAAAPQPRQVAFARARRGIIESIVTDAPADTLLENCEFRPWRPRPKPMRVPLAGNAERAAQGDDGDESRRGQAAHPAFR